MIALHPSLTPNGHHPRHNWAADAACRGMGPDRFYPFDDDTDDEAEAAAAKEVCATCPVRDDCLTSAIESREQYGIWGGMTSRERRRMIRRARRARARRAAA